MPRRFYLLLLFLPPLIFAVLLFPFQKVFTSGDALFQYYPYASFLSRSLQAGASPIFASGILGGFPVGASMSGGFWHPLHLLVFQFLDFLSGYHALVILYFGAGLGAMYVFLRALQFAPGSALVGALAYGLGQYSLAWLPVLPHVQPIFIFPLLFYAVLRAPDRWWGTFLGGAVLAWGWLAASPHMVSMAALAAGFFALFLDAGRSGNFFALARLQATGRYLLMGLLSAALAAPYLLLAASFHAVSVRPFLSFAEYHGGALAPAALLRYLMPSLAIPYLVPAEIISIGFAAIFLAFIAFRYARHDPFIRFFGGLAVFAILAGLKYSPLTVLFHYLPVFKYFRGPARFVHLAGFALSVLAARGFAELQSGDLVSRVRIWVRRFSGFWALVAVLGMLGTVGGLFLREPILRHLFGYFDERLYTRTSQLPLEHYHRVIENYLDQFLGSFSFQSPAFLLTVLAAFAALALFTRIARRGATELSPLLCGLVVMTEMLGGYFLAKPVADSSLLRPPELLERLRERQDEAPYRVFSLWPRAESYQRVGSRRGADGASQARFALDLLAPNTGLLWGVDTIDGYDNLMPRRLAALLAFAGSERSTAGEALADAASPDSQKLALFLERLPALGRLGVRYLISARPLSHPDLVLLGRDSADSGQLPIYLYRYQNASPLFEFAAAVEFKNLKSDADLSRHFAALSHSPDASIAIACASCAVLPEELPLRDTIELVVWQDGQAKFRVYAGRPRWFILRNTLLPGWQASLDGVPTSIHEADGIFQAVAVPAGWHDVEFRFSPWLALAESLRVWQIHRRVVQ